jgi:cell division protein FtsB
MNKTKVNPIFKVIFVLFLAYAVFTFFDQQKLIDGKRFELIQVKDEIEAGQKDLSELEKEKDMLMTDESLEKIAREKLGMVKPGERVFIDVGRQ